MQLTQLEISIRKIFNVLDLDFDNDASIIQNFSGEGDFEFWKRSGTYSLVWAVSTSDLEFKDAVFNDGFFYAEIKLNENFVSFEISLLNLDYKDFFFMVISDMIFRSTEVANDLGALMDRYNSWREFIKLILIPKSDTGLWGELCFLNFLIDNKIGDVRSWIGPDFATHDFKLANQFVEIKTTLNKYKNIISVNGIMQLNTDEKLALCLIRIVKVSDDGLSLQGMVREIKSKISSIDRSLLDSKLKRFNSVIEMSKDQFSIESYNIYDVDEDFPRINSNSFKNNKIPKGISYISYMVDLSNLEGKGEFDYFNI